MRERKELGGRKRAKGREKGKKKGRWLCGWARESASERIDCYIDRVARESANTFESIALDRAVYFRAKKEKLIKSS